MRRIIGLCALLASMGACELVAATLTGRVLDPSKAVVPGVTLYLRNMDTNETLTARSDPVGSYIFRSVRAGKYSLSAEAPNFETSVRENLKLRDEQNLTVDVVLRLRAMAEQVTVTAKAPKFETALEVRDVKESSARDVGEALTNVEGLWKIRKGGIANDVVLRGFQSGNLNVLVDGARIFGACPNHMDPPAFHVDFAEVQEVAVTKGAFDIRNQGSLGGLVQIINKQPARGFHVMPSVSTGSFGFVNPSVTGSLSNGKSYAMLGYSYRRSDPYTDGSGRPFTAYANYRDTARDQSAFDIQTGWAKFGLSPWENHRLELGYTRQDAGQTLYPYLMMDALYDNADRLKASYDISNLTSAFKHLRVQSYFTQVHHWMTDEFRTSSIGAARPYTMATLAKTQAFGVKADAEISDLAVGVEVFRRNWDATNSMRMTGSYMNQSAIPDVNMLVAGAYADYRRLFFGKLSFQAGARLDRARSEAQSQMLNTDLFWAYNGTRLKSSTDTNPAGHVQLAYRLGKGVDLFAGVGHMVRLPDPVERYFALKRMGSDWVGNPNLRPTENNEVDLGINYGAGRFRVRPTLFYSRLTDFIILHNQPRINNIMGVMNSMARSYANVDAKLYGGELTYSVGITRSLLFLGGTSYTVGKDTPRPEYNIFSTRLAEIPPLKTRGVLRYGTRRFFGEVEGIAVNAQNQVDTDLKELRTPGYFTMGVKTGLHASKLNLAVGIDNLLNRFYYEYLSFQRDPFRSGVKVPEPGRNFYLTVSYGF